MKIDLSFPGGKQVDAHFNGMTVHTDQAVEDGGDGSGPTPFDYFFVSLATCAGITALAYCRKYDIDTEGLAVSLTGELDESVYHYTKVTFHVTLPTGFPAEHRERFEKRVGSCVVKKHIVNPPEFALVVSG